MSRIDSAERYSPPPDEAEERHALEILQGSRHFVRWKQILVGLATVAFSVFASYLLLNNELRYAVAAVGTTAVCVAIVIAPQVGMWIYYILAFARPQEVFWGLGELRLSLAVASVTLVAWLVYTGLRRGVYLRPHAQIRLMLAFAAVVAASALVKDGDWNRVIDFIKMFLVGIAFASFMVKRSWFRTSLGLLTGCFIFLGLWGLDQKFNQGVWQLHGPGIAGDGTLYDRNAYSMFLVMGLPFCYLAGTRFRFKIVRPGFLLLFVALAYAILQTSSRGGLLGIGAVVLTIAGQTRFKVPAIAVGTAAMVAFYLVAAPATLKDRAGTIVNYEEEESATGRLDSWRAGGKMMLHNPFLGVGPGNYVRAYSRYESTYARQAHNSIVQCGGEFGFTGLAIYLSLIGLSIRDLRRLARRYRNDPEIHAWVRTITTSLVGYMVCGFFLSMEDFELLYFLVVLIVSLQVVLAHERDDRAAEVPA